MERRLPESNRRKRLCRPLRNHSAKAPRGASVAGTGGPLGSFGCRRSSCAAPGRSPIARRGPTALSAARRCCSCTGFRRARGCGSRLMEALAGGRTALRSRPTSTGSATRPTRRRRPSSTTSRRLSAFIDGARARARRARRPRLGRVRRPRLGVRAPGPDRGAGDQRHRLLRRRQVARDGGGGPRRAGRGAGRRDRPRRVRRAPARAGDDAVRRRGRSTPTGAPFDDGRGQRATLDFYRSMDFEKLEP